MIIDKPTITNDLTTSITAHAGGGQANAVAITTQNNNITVSAAAGDSVKLPASFVAGYCVTIANNGAYRADVFPASGDNLGLGADIAVQLLPGQAINLLAVTADSTWVIV